MDSRDIAKHLSKSKNFVYILAKQFDELFDQKYFSRISFCYPELAHPHGAQCLKIAEKVTFNIASEASYVYTLSGQKFIKNAKNGPF